MKKILLSLALMAAIGNPLSSMAGDAKTYQVTGPVLEVTDKYIVVQKDEDKWQIAADRTMLSKVKKGDKVTIKYQMTATDLEVKPSKTTKK